MNHMANEFYFEGHAESQAPWRFHENRGEREYERPEAKLSTKKSERRMEKK